MKPSPFSIVFLLLLLIAFTTSGCLHFRLGVRGLHEEQVSQEVPGSWGVAGLVSMGMGGDVHDNAAVYVASSIAVGGAKPSGEEFSGAMSANGGVEYLYVPDKRSWALPFRLGVGLANLTHMTKSSPRDDDGPDPLVDMHVGVLGPVWVNKGGGCFLGGGHMCIGSNPGSVVGMSTTLGRQQSMTGSSGSVNYLDLAFEFNSF